MENFNLSCMPNVVLLLLVLIIIIVVVVVVVVVVVIGFQLHVTIQWVQCTNRHICNVEARLQPLNGVAGGGGGGRDKLWIRQVRDLILTTCSMEDSLYRHPWNIQTGASVQYIYSWYVISLSNGLLISASLSSINHWCRSIYSIFDILKTPTLSFSLPHLLGDTQLNYMFQPFCESDPSTEGGTIPFSSEI